MSIGAATKGGTHGYCRSRRAHRITAAHHRRAPPPLPPRDAKCALHVLWSGLLPMLYSTERNPDWKVLRNMVDEPEPREKRSRVEKRNRPRRKRRTVLRL